MGDSRVGLGECFKGRRWVGDRRHGSGRIRIEGLLSTELVLDSFQTMAACLGQGGCIGSCSSRGGAGRGKEDWVGCGSRAVAVDTGP